MALADMFGVGISTIRRDLDALDREGKLVRVHGGAVVVETAAPRIPYVQSRNLHVAEKAAIARAALRFLPEGGSVFIGGGSTTLQLALVIPAEIGLSVTTNALDIAAHIAAGGIAPVDLVGGSVRPESLQTNCEEALIQGLFWDVTFMGLAAVDMTRGITTDSRFTARQEQLILKQGGKFVALCDSSKIGRYAYAQMAPVSAMDVFITDSGADPEFVRQLESEGVQVVIAD
jgi:DeoR family fructose operon transcriptional repressor